MELGSFQWCTAIGPQAMGNGHIETQEICLNIGKHFFVGRGVKHWHRLPRKVVETPSLETLKSHLDVVLGTQH